MTRIDIRALRKTYNSKTTVMQGIDLEIASRDFLVILGPSGCGKSTLLRMIAGLEDISGGTIEIGGRVVNDLEPRERGCAMVFQNYALYPHMTVAENIGYALKVAGMAKAERAARVAETAKALELGHLLDRRPAELSGGQRQRVAMGRAMIREPGVFLFDEPLSNLDAKLRVQMRAEIRRLHRRLGTTSVFVTHDQVEAMTLADKMVVMNAGRIEQYGTPAEIYDRPATAFVAGFVGSPPMNLFAGDIVPGGVMVPGGLVLPFRPVPAASTAAAASRGVVTLGLRAEAIGITPPGTPGTVTGTIEFVEELGAGRVIHAAVDEAMIAVMTQERGTFAPGERIGLALRAADLHAFDPVTGARLDAQADRHSPSTSAAWAAQAHS